MNSFLGKRSLPAAAASADDGAALVGALKKRPADVPRGENGLFDVLTRYLDGTMSKTEKQSGVSAERQYLLAKMESITRAVLGRPKDEARNREEIKPSTVTSLNLLESEVSKYVAVRDKVKLHSEKATRMDQIVAQLTGGTSVPKLKLLPETGKGGQIGTLVTLCAEMRTWLAAESAASPAADIMRDRLTFAAAALPQVAILRDKMVGLATQVLDLKRKAKHAHDSAVWAGLLDSEGGAASPATGAAATGAAAMPPTQASQEGKSYATVCTSRGAAQSRRRRASSRASSSSRSERTM